MSHPKTRGERRSHTARIKKRFYRKQALNPWWCTSERNAGIFANHGKVCSCWMCGNPRRHMKKGLTLQELKIDFK